MGHLYGRFGHSRGDLLDIGLDSGVGSASDVHSASTNRSRPPPT